MFLIALVWEVFRIKMLQPSDLILEQQAALLHRSQFLIVELAGVLQGHDLLV